jgi:hypothetical protein
MREGDEVLNTFAQLSCQDDFFIAAVFTVGIDLTICEQC